jgi:hypothetical protein
MRGPAGSRATQELCGSLHSRQLPIAPLSSSEVHPLFSSEVHPLLSTYAYLMGYRLGFASARDHLEANGLRHTGSMSSSRQSAVGFCDGTSDKPASSTAGPHLAPASHWFANTGTSLAISRKYARRLILPCAALLGAHSTTISKRPRATRRKIAPRAARLCAPGCLICRI